MTWVKKLLSGGKSAQTGRSQSNNAADLLAEGMRHGQNGRWTEAADYFERATLADPNIADAHHNLGVALLNLGRAEEAVHAAQRAVSFDDSNIGYLLNLGNAAVRAQDMQTAESALRRALETTPNDLRITSNLGIVLLQQEKWDEAVIYLQRAAATSATPSAMLVPLAKALWKSGSPETALRTIDQYLSVDPNSQEGITLRFHILSALERWDDVVTVGEEILSRNDIDGLSAYWLAEAYSNLGENNRAIDVLSLFTERNPGHLKVHAKLAELHQSEGNEPGAQEAFEAYIRARPDDCIGYYNLGYQHHRTADYVAALESYGRALAISQNHAPTLNGLGKLHYELRQFKEAETYFRRCLTIEPDFNGAMSDLSTVLVSTGRLAEGLDLYSDRRLVDTRPALKWIDKTTDGLHRDISEKTVLIMREQGLGDELRWSGCYGDAIRDSKRCIIQCDLRLEAIFKRSFPDSKIYPVRPIDSGTNRPDRDSFDLILLAGDLPTRYRRNLTDFPDRNNVFTADPDLRTEWRNRLDALGAGLKVGICWRSGSVNWHRMRTAMYTHLDEWGDVLQVANTQFVNLFYDQCETELEGIRKQFGVHIHHWPEADLLDDLDTVFALISQLDLVISVQTAVLDMAGAIGTETWGILSPNLLMGETYVPWYKSVKPIPYTLGEPNEVILGRVARELEQRAAAHASGQI